MQPRHSIAATLIVACTLAGTSVVVHAQASAPALPDLPGAGASAPAPARAGPRLRSAAEVANRAAAPGELRPERPVTPQITIPLGRKPPAVPKRDTLPRNGSAPAGGVEEAAARCESQVDPQELAACRAKLARESRAKLPN